ncbi:MAG TPA: c-type cytochrome [Gemmataceae bacterium]|jgi:mono/diheme cytochrome c family protein|nr:c-type cytochrome [Gemmataceae bacterium]
MIRGLVFLLACCIVGFSLLAGCKKEAAPPVGENAPPKPGGGNPPPPADIDPSDKFAAGKTTFRTNCARCHSTTAPGEGGKMRGGKAPNLAKVAADPEHTKEWLADHIRDPKSHKPQSTMPKFAGKLKEEDIKTLADYLASLK